MDGLVSLPDSYEDVKEILISVSAEDEDVVEVSEVIVIGCMKSRKLCWSSRKLLIEFIFFYNTRNSICVSGNVSHCSP